VAPEEPPAPVPAAEGPDSALGRLVGAFVSPSRTFAAIAARPTWLAPLLLWMSLSFLVGEIVVARTDWGSVIREGASRREQKLTDPQIDDAVARSTRFSWIFEIFAAAAPAIVAGATAAALWLSCQAFGWEIRFRQSFGVTLHAFLPSVVASVVLLGMLWNRATIDPQTVGDLLPTNPGVGVNARSQATLHALLSSLDVLSFWTMGLLVLGLSAATRAPRARVAMMVLVLWGLFVLGKAGVAAIFA